MESRQLRVDSDLFTPSNFDSQFDYEENVPNGHTNEIGKMKLIFIKKRRRKL